MKDVLKAVKGQIWVWNDPIFKKKSVGCSVPVEEGGMRYTRPILIIQNIDELNDNTVLACPMTTVPDKKFTVKVTYSDSEQSWVRCDKIFPAHISTLSRYIGVINPHKMNDVLNVISSIISHPSESILSDINQTDISDDILSNISEETTTDETIVEAVGEETTDLPVDPTESEELTKEVEQIPDAVTEGNIVSSELRPKEIVYQIGYNNKRVWSDEGKQAMIWNADNFGINVAAEVAGINVSTARTYVSKFRKELKNTSTMNIIADSNQETDTSVNISAEETVENTDDHYDEISDDITDDNQLAISSGYRITNGLMRNSDDSEVVFSTDNPDDIYTNIDHDTLVKVTSNLKKKVSKISNFIGMYCKYVKNMGNYMALYGSDRIKVRKDFNFDDKLSDCIYTAICNTIGIVNQFDNDHPNQTIMPDYYEGTAIDQMVSNINRYYDLFKGRDPLHTFNEEDVERWENADIIFPVEFFVELRTSVTKTLPLNEKGIEKVVSGITEFCE